MLIFDYQMPKKKKRKSQERTNIENDQNKRTKENMIPWVKLTPILSNEKTKQKGLGEQKKKKTWYY